MKLGKGQKLSRRGGRHAYSIKISSILLPLYITIILISSAIMPTCLDLTLNLLHLLRCFLPITQVSCLLGDVSTLLSC